jgi:hypothetical protein
MLVLYSLFPSESMATGSSKGRRKLETPKRTTKTSSAPYNLPWLAISTAASVPEHSFFGHDSVSDLGLVVALSGV